MPISFNVILTIIGRQDLTNKMLPSLNLEMDENDILTLISDDNHEFVKNALSQFKFKCKVFYFKNENRLGYWGHVSRNKYQNNLKGDYILHADDDDEFIKGSFKLIKHRVKKDFENNVKKVYFYRGICGYIPYWKTHGIVEIGNIITSCGVIYNVGQFPSWGLFYGGDGFFYKNLVKMLDYEFVDEFIFNINSDK